MLTHADNKEDREPQEHWEGPQVTKPPVRLTSQTASGKFCILRAPGRRPPPEISSTMCEMWVFAKSGPYGSSTFLLQREEGGKRPRDFSVDILVRHQKANAPLRFSESQDGVAHPEHPPLRKRARVSARALHANAERRAWHNSAAVACHRARAENTFGRSL